LFLRKTWASAIGLTLVTSSVVAIATSTPAAAAVQGKVVSADPVDFTPQVQDGAVKSIVQIGDRVYIGGSFTQVKAAGANKPTITRNGLFAVKATTGEIIPDFNPNVGGGEVSVVLPSEDGKSLYVGGAFKTIGGVGRFVLGKVNATTGALDATFKPQFNARIKDLRLAGGRLYVGGNFSTVSGVARPALATVNPTTGARDDFLDLQFTGTQNGGSTLAYKMDVSPDGSKLVVVGNFTHVAGQRRQQAVMVDLTGSTAQLANWHMRDVDFSPNGEFFVITTTGAAGGIAKLCDTQVRWESDATGTNLEPTWVNQTGGDTTYAVEITETAVYVGGHFRWSSNPFGVDTAGQGAVSREGLAALDPDNGMPFSWNPGRTRGVGVFDLLATDQGLWMGSDTDIAGGETHMKMAMFPLAGGTEVPKKNLGKLPGNVYYGGGIGLGSQNYLRHRSFDGTTAQAPVNDATGGIDWRNQRGAFMISGKLYHGSSNGKFYVRDFDGTTFGAPSEINTSDQLTHMSTWHDQVKSIRGMFFAGGRIYYTRGNNSLYYRYFTPQNGVVGPQEWTASTSLPGGWSNVYGMFAHGGQLYYVSSSDWRLRKIGFQGGVVSGNPVVVDSGDWRGRVLFLNALTPNEPPNASFTRNCDQLECGFNASGSTDPDGTITGYEWDFGDGSTGTGQTASHTYAEAGTYTVKLTVTDNRGDTGTTSQQITVSPTQVNIGFRGTDGYNANTVKATVTVPASVQAGDGLLLILNVNGTGVEITPPAGWQQVATQSGIARSTVWQRVAQAGDAGKAVDVALSAYAKADLRLLAYSGTSTTEPVAAVGQAADPASVTEHTTPTVNVAGGGNWVVSYWSDKSSSTTAWTAPGGVTSRATSIGTGSGRATSLVADSNGVAQTGSYGGLTATTDAASRALMWTIVLARKS
jgi:PKD repeat protein